MYEITALSIEISRMNNEPLRVEDILSIKAKIPANTLGKATIIHRLHANNRILSIDIKATRNDITSAKQLATWAIAMAEELKRDRILDYKVVRV